MRRVWQSAAMMSWLALAVRLGSLALLMPLVLAKFSNAEVSVWLLFASIASFQVIVDFGFGPTFSREIAYGFAGNSLVYLRKSDEHQLKIQGDMTAIPNWDAIASATVAMLWLYRRLALVVLLLLATFGTWASMVPIERTAQPDASWMAWCFVVLTTAASIYGNAYASFLIGANRIELQKRWEAVVSGASLIAQSVVVLMNMGLPWLVLVAQMGIVVQVLVNRSLAFRISEGRFGHSARAEPGGLVLRSIWPAAWRTAIGAIMGMGVAQGIAIVMANILFAAEAASVQLALRVMQIISQFSQVPFYTKIPQLNRLRAGARASLLAKASAKAMRNSLTVYVAGAIIVNLFIDKLLVWIGSKTLYPDKEFWMLLVLAVFAERFGAMHINLLLTSNKAIAHVANGVTGVIWVGGMLVIFPIIGSLALPLSMLIAYAGFYAWYSALHSHRGLTGVSAWRFEIRASLFPTLLVAAWAVYMMLYDK